MYCCSFQGPVWLKFGSSLIIAVIDRNRNMLLMQFYCADIFICTDLHILTVVVRIKSLDTCRHVLNGNGEINAGDISQMASKITHYTTI